MGLRSQLMLRMRLMLCVDCRSLSVVWFLLSLYLCRRILVLASWKGRSDVDVDLHRIYYH